MSEKMKQGKRVENLRRGVKRSFFESVTFEQRYE